MKRGYWVVHRVLGEVIPPPPPVVPELPSDEAKSDLPMRDMLAQHRANVVCAACHARFDTFGLAFEGYGPVGDARAKDLAGRPIDAKASFPGGSEGTGLEGVRTYIRENRQNQFLDGLERKLLVYALNRSLLLSDELVIDRMQAKLAANHYRFSSLVETIVTSPQFLNQRNSEATEKTAPQTAALRQSKRQKGELECRSQRKIPLLASHAVRFFAAPESRSPCLGWSRFLRSEIALLPPSSRSASGSMFMGNGINENNWSAEGSGADMTLSKTLSPLEPLKHKINVIDGLFNKAATGHGIHPPQTGSLLSGAEIQKGAVIHSGISVDQMIANAVGQDTPQSSIVLACEQPMSGYHETNYSMAYSSHISWQTPDSPVPVEIYPSLAWDNLFENRGSLLNVSILDRVKDRAETLSRKVSSNDKTKLDEYLTSVREVEKRVESTRKVKDQSDELAKRRTARPSRWTGRQNGLPEDLRDHAQADVRHHRHRVSDGQHACGFSDYFAERSREIISEATRVRSV